MFAPALFVILKCILDQSHAAKCSHMLEVSIQIGSAVSIFCSGYIYNSMGFLFVIGLGGIFIAASGFLLVGVKVKSERKLQKCNVLKEYRNYIRILINLCFKKSAERKQYLFGIIHQFPQSIILVLNIPLILFVSECMKKGPIEYGILDATIGISAMVCGFFWSKHYRLGQKKAFIVLMPIAAFVLFIIIPFINPEGIIPYILFYILAIFLSSSKIQCRAAVLIQTPAASIGELTSFYQIINSLILIAMSFVISYLIHIISIHCIFIIMGFLMVLFGLTLTILYKE